MRAHIARRGVLTAICLGGALAALGLLRVGWGADPVTERVSVSTSGLEGNLSSLHPAVSADGRFVAFASDALSLVPGDTNARDIYVRDRLAGTTELVSVASDGTQANRSALSPDISADGRFVVFYSDADNLVPDDTNGFSDIFLHDRLTGTTERVSVADGGTEGNGDSLTPSISGDGRYVTFTSLANNLVPDDTNDDRDVFVHDRLTGVTELVSVSTDGTQGNFASGGQGAGPARISSDGRYVVFGSFASNLVPDDTNQADDIFLRDRLAGSTERVSISSEGGQAISHSMYPDVSDDGRFVVFHSLSDDLVPEDEGTATDVFLRDRELGTTVRLSTAPGGAEPNNASHFPVISADGRTVAFNSEASNLVPDDSNGKDDVFLRHLESGELERISVADDGSAGDGNSTFAAISDDGSVLAYESYATNLVPDDTNGVTDIFVWGKSAATPATPTATPTSVPAAQPGDVNCDEVVSSIDAALVLQFGAGILDELLCPDAADASGDGALNAIDAALILQFVAGLLDTLPP